MMDGIWHCKKIPVAAMLLLLSLTCGLAQSLTRGPPLGPYKAAARRASSLVYLQDSKTPYIEHCKVYFRNATLDHFSWVRCFLFGSGLLVLL